jgi:hypothetical protein
MLSDIRFAFRMLRKNPALTTAVVSTGAIRIGINTAIFSLVNAVLIQTLPYPEIQRIVTIMKYQRPGEDESLCMIRG